MSLGGSFAQGTVARTFSVGPALAQAVATGGLRPAAALAPAAGLLPDPPTPDAYARQVAAVAAGQELQQVPPKRFTATAEPTTFIVTGDLGVMAGLRALGAFTEEG